MQSKFKKRGISLENWEVKAYTNISAKYKNSSYFVVLHFVFVWLFGFGLVCFSKKGIHNPFRRGVVSSTGCLPMYPLFVLPHRSM